MAKLKLKFYTSIGNIIVRVDKIQSLFEVVSVNFDDFLNFLKDSGRPPFTILVEQNVLDKLNVDIARAACSKFHSNVIRIYVEPNGFPVIEIKLN